MALVSGQCAKGLSGFHDAQKSHRGDSVAMTTFPVLEVSSFGVTAVPLRLLESPGIGICVRSNPGWIDQHNSSLHLIPCGMKCVIAEN